MLILSEACEGEKGNGTEKQDHGDARGPSDPRARHAVQHHDSTSPEYIVLCLRAFASDVSQQSYQTMSCRRYTMKVPNIATSSTRWLVFFPHGQGEPPAARAALARQRPIQQGLDARLSTQALPCNNMEGEE